MTGPKHNYPYPNAGDIFCTKDYTALFVKVDMDKKLAEVRLCDSLDKAKLIRKELGLIKADG